MSHIVILGAGVMGSAFSRPLTDNGHRISLVGTHLDGDIIEEVHESGLHPGLGVHLNRTLLTPYTYDRLPEVMAETDLVVLGVNSLGIDWAAEMLAPVLSPQTPVIMLTKGLYGDGQTLSILPHALRQNLPGDLAQNLPLLAVGGPSIAGELAVGHHTCVQIAGTDQALLEKMAQTMRTPYYHVWTNTDLVGVEVCVAMKNLYALATGMIAGVVEKEGHGQNKAAMHNMAAAIFTQGLHETAYLVEKMGGNVRNVYGLPGAGDLYVTCQGGRNSRMGRLLGLGMVYADAKAQHMPDDTVEGAELAQAIGQTVEAMVARGDLDAGQIPLMLTMIRIVCHNEPMAIPWGDFFG